jgi:bifunctional non-homologous end joining protein LigD
MPLDKYREKRKFRHTPEPAGEPSLAGTESQRGGRFVVQRHAARRLHYDFRLEIDGVLKSWAIPKGPSLNPADKRLAVMTEDHPLEYGDFEGEIPKGNYGAGTVMIWDNGHYFTEGDLSAGEQLARGEIKFLLKGKKLHGSFALVRMKRTSKGGRDGNEWLLIKHRDAVADPDWNIDLHGGSVVSDTGGTSPGSLEGATRASMPQEVEPMLATLVDEPFSSPDWLFEVKWDGMRALAWIKGNDCSLRSRTGRTVTSNFPELSVLRERLAAQEAILDGEIVVLDTEGRARFEPLQSRMNVTQPAAALVESVPVDYYIFDILYCDGYDLRQVPLIERKRFLAQVLEPRPPVRYSDHILEKGSELLDAARKRGTEGVIGKQIHSPYVSGRSRHWVKLKVTKELDAVVGGFTAPRGSRDYFGALLLGLHEKGKLKFIGSVGTGFTEDSQKELYSQLSELEISHCPFKTRPDTKEEARWVRPALVAHVKYGEWTREPRLRQPVFIELRPGVEPGECLLGGELPAEPARPSKVITRTVPQLTTLREVEQELLHGKSETVSLELDGKSIRLSNLNKVYFPKRGYTKRDLLRHYYEVSGYILPFLRNRPLVLRRHPNGIEEQYFYQKEAGADVPDWMTTVSIPSEERRKEIRYYVCNDVAALLFLTNLGCIEHNPWSSQVDDLERPDYVFFDLDPAEGTEFSTVVEVARHIHRTLQQIGCKVFLKTSGATGLHMYLPLERVYDYEQIRTFAEIVARLLAGRMPDEVTLDRFTDKRDAGKVYIDYSQNAYGRPLASVYSVRPLPDAPVSAPITFRELRRTLSPTRFTLATMALRLKRSGDLWAEFWESRQRIEPALDCLRNLL